MITGNRKAESKLFILLYNTTVMKAIYYKLQIWFLSRKVFITVLF